MYFINAAYVYLKILHRVIRRIAEVNSLARVFLGHALYIARETDFTVKLVFVVSAVTIPCCIIIIAHLRGLYCAFGQVLLHLCSLRVADVITLP